MRILCVIMVGAFLLSIAIADNGNSLRPSPPDYTGQLPQPTSINQGLLPQPKSASYPSPWPSVQPKPTNNIAWTSQQRAVPKNPIYSQPSNDLTVDDNLASAAISSAQYSPALNSLDLGKPLLAADSKIMILEPMSRPRKPSWTDWMPDFFLDDSSEKGPGPLIGPVDMPGMGSQVYIRQSTPPPDDVDHVVIHVVNRIGESVFIPPSLPTQALQLQPEHQELVSYYSKDSHLRPESFLSSGSETTNVVNGSPWNLQANIPDLAIHDKKFQHSASDGAHESANDETKPKFTVMLLKQAGSRPPSVVWSRPVDRQGYGRSHSPTAYQEPVSFPNAPHSEDRTSRNGSYPSISDYRDLNRPLRYTGPPVYGYPNGTRAPSESAAAHLPEESSNRAHDEILRFKPSQPDEITALNQQPPPTADLVSLTEPSNAEDQPLRSPRNRYSASNHFARANFARPVTSTAEPSPPPRQTSDEFEQGGLQIVPAPNLAAESAETLTAGRARLRSNSSEEVVQNIMSMTASQAWKNITSRSAKENEAGEGARFEAKKDARNEAKKVARGDSKYNYRTQSRNSTRAAARSSSRAKSSPQAELKNNTRNALKNDALPEMKNSTRTETKNNTRISTRKIIGVEVKKSTSVEIKKSVRPEVKKNIRTDAKNSSNVGLKKTSPIVKNITGNENKANPSSGVKKNLSSEPKKNVTSELKQNVSSEAKQNISSEVKKNVSSEVKKEVNSQVRKDNSTEIKKPTTTQTPIMQRRSDHGRSIIVDVETKDVPRAEAITAPEANKINKAEAKMREAVRKIMSSFSQWRHKPVTTDFIEELDEKKKNRKKN